MLSPTEVALYRIRMTIAVMYSLSVVAHLLALRWPFGVPESTAEHAVFVGLNFIGMLMFAWNPSIVMRVFFTGILFVEQSIEHGYLFVRGLREGAFDLQSFSAVVFAVLTFGVAFGELLIMRRQALAYRAELEAAELAQKVGARLPHDD